MGTIKEHKKQIEELEGKIKKLEVEISNRDRKIQHLEGKLGEAPTTVTETVTETVTIDHTDELDKLQQRIRELEEALRKKDMEIDEGKKKLSKAMSSMKEGGKQVVVEEDPETKRLLEQALQVEKELRAANEALEKALARAHEEIDDLKEELAK